MKKISKKTQEPSATFDTMLAVRLDPKTVRRIKWAQGKLSKTQPGVSKSMLVREAIVYWLDHAPELA